MGGDEIGHRGHRCGGGGPVFDRRDQPEMTGGHFEFGHARQRAQHRQTDAVAGRTQDLFVAFAADPVEDHPAEADGAVVGGESVQ